MIKGNGKDEAGIGSEILYTPLCEKRKKLIKLQTFLHGNLRSAILDLWTMSFKMEANGVTPIPPPTNTATSYLYQS